MPDISNRDTQSPAAASIRVEVSDLPAFKAFMERVRDFINEYAWHTRDCAAIDADGQWRQGNAPCSCGYDEALAALVPPGGDRG